MKPDLRKRITEEQLDELEHNLEGFLEDYWNNVLIHTDEEYTAFKNIEKIQQLLKMKRYEELFDDLSIIQTYYEMDLIT